MWTLKYRSLLAVAVVSALPIAIPLAGCSIARALTTRHLDFDQNLIPSRNNGLPFNPGTANTNGVIAFTGDIAITGDVKTKFDKYHGGVDSAWFTYQAVNKADQPVRVRLWAFLEPSSQTCPVPLGGVPQNAPLLLDVTIPANQTVTFTKDQGHNIEALRQLAEQLLKGDNLASCVYAEEDSAATGTGEGVILNQLDIVGRAHGSYF